MTDPDKLRTALAPFTGTENYHRHWLRRLIYTDGVEHFTEHAGGGAYWFLDIVATEVMPLLKKAEFIAITISSASGQANIFATDGNDERLWQRWIEHTDCPAGEWKFYLVLGSLDGVNPAPILMLPSEY